jgi:hypothetical protein
MAVSSLLATALVLATSSNPAAETHVLDEGLAPGRSPIVELWLADSLLQPSAPESTPEARPALHLEEQTEDGATGSDFPWDLHLGALGTPARGAHDRIFGARTLRRASDQMLETGLSLVHPLTDGIRANLNWRMERNTSNLDRYEYERHVFGLYLQFDLSERAAKR